MSTNSTPLVSVVVVTYNSAAFVIETLDSIKNQTYQNVELIITDDCSVDDTVAICYKWIEQNINRFVRVELVTSPINTGITPNLNRGIMAARGEWIKTIAGDDALFSYTIEKYIEYSKANPTVEFLHSDIVVYQNTFDEENKLPSLHQTKSRINQEEVTPEEQFQILLRTCRIAAATVMIRKSVYDKVGLFDEAYRLWEDRPMWLKITSNNIKLVYLKIYGAKYRQSSGSVIRNKREGAMFNDFYLQKSRIIYDNYLPLLPRTERILKKVMIGRVLWMSKRGLNKNSLFMKLFIKMTDFPLSLIIKKIDNSYD